MKMFTTLALLAVSVTAIPFSEDFINSKIDEGMNNYRNTIQVVEQTDGNFLNRIAYQLGLSRENIVEPPQNNGTCAPCVKSGVKHIMESVVAAVKKECEETKCPVLKKHCAMWAKHPEVSFGWLFAKVRPISISYAYCYGKGSCQHPKMESAPAVKGLELTEQFDNEEAEKLFDDALGFYGQPQDLLVESQSEANSFMELVDFRHKKHHCGMCIRKTACCVMKHAIKRIKHFCEHTKDPKAKARCAMCKAHPKFALGVLIYKIRPGEWGCGYCFGNGHCGKKEDADGFEVEVAHYLEENELF